VGTLALCAGGFGDFGFERSPFEIRFYANENIDLNHRCAMIVIAVLGDVAQKGVSNARRIEERRTSS
jgi:hypothetical protein